MKTVRAVLSVVPVALALAVVSACAAPPAPGGGGGGSSVYAPNVDASGATDVSAPMAAFFRSVPNGATVDLRANGRYRMEQPLEIAGRKNLTIRGNGATFFATSTGDFNRSSVRIIDGTGINVQNLKVVGANPAAGQRGGYLGTLDGQHGIVILSSTEVSLTGVSVSDTYGDFVYLGRRNGGIFTDGVVIQRSTFTRSGRQGIAITGARNVVIDSSTIMEAKRASIDLEPGSGARSVVDGITIRNNQIIRGGLLFVAANGHGAVNNVTVANNRLTGMTMGINVKDLDGGRRHGWTVTGNVADLPSGGNQTLTFTRVDGVTVRGNTQPMKPMRNMIGVLADGSCGITVSGNAFPHAVAQYRTIPAPPSC